MVTDSPNIKGELTFLNPKNECLTLIGLYEIQQKFYLLFFNVKPFRITWVKPESLVIPR